MFKTLLLCSALGILVAAFVPYRNEYSEEETDYERLEREARTVYCAYYTPCGWTIYKRLGDYKIGTDNITNDYCICAPGFSCVMTGDLSKDTDTTAFVYYCKPDPIQPHAETTTQVAQETTTQS